MAIHPAAGLQADWLNGWLAAIGITVLIPDARLAWTHEPTPAAELHLPTHDPATYIYQALPTHQWFDQLAIARHHPQADQFPRKVSLDTYQARVPLERAAAHPSLAHSVTDLVPPEDGVLPHSPFDVPAPKGLTLWDRAKKTRAHITSPDWIADTLAGRGRRIEDNGLGFDVRRLASRADDTDKRSDPVVETLTFCALALFPIRGNGRSDTTRGWIRPPSQQGAFHWAAWRAPLDRWAIDAWLDRFHADIEADVLQCYATAPYRQTGSSDATRAYATMRLT